MALREIDIKTGLYTPGFFVAFGARELAFARLDGYPVSVILLNIRNCTDHSIIEDTEKVLYSLKQVGDVIRQQAGEGSIVARVSDVEIAILLPGVGLGKARKTGETIKVAVDAHLKELGKEENDVCMGIASTVDGQVEFLDLVRASRSAMKVASA